jgi:pimeloyl-ACP methyl ester carboxylesterase
MFFPGFTLDEAAVKEGPVRLRRGGSGPPLLLLHGNPQTHAMWNAVAPELARRFTVICPDLRGYGGSLKPPATPDHAPYAKRAMAADMVAAMARLRFDRFAVAGHDRGGRVAYRLALDHPRRVDRIAVLDVLPTAKAWTRADARFALAFWPWAGPACTAARAPAGRGAGRGDRRRARRLGLSRRGLQRRRACRLRGGAAGPRPSARDLRGIPGRRDARPRARRGRPGARPAHHLPPARPLERAGSARNVV